MRSHLLAALLVVFALGLACGFGTETPGSAAIEFWQHVKDGNTSSAYGMMEESARTGDGVLVRRGGATRFMADLGAEGEGGISEFSVVKEEVRGETACVTVNLTLANGGVVPVVLAMLKEAEGWHIVIDQYTYGPIQTKTSRHCTVIPKTTEDF